MATRGLGGPLDEFGIPMGMRIDTRVWDLPDTEFWGDDWEEGDARLPGPIMILTMVTCLLAIALSLYAGFTGANWPLYITSGLGFGVALIGGSLVMLGRRRGSEEL